MQTKLLIVSVTIPVLLSVIIWKFFAPDSVNMICYQDIETREVLCRPLCPHGFFALPYMSHCRRWLKCAEIERDVKIQEPLDNGAVKAVFLAKWQDHTVVYNAMVNPDHITDFHHGLKMVASFQPHSQVIQLIGHCRNIFLTEHHRFGTADKLIATLTKPEFKKYDTVGIRFGLCIQYAKIIEFLHNSPHGTRVMCDSNDLQKALSQILVSSDLFLLVNDLDALPKVNRSKDLLIKCGHRQLHGDFVAPEQHWPFESEPFNDDSMPGYDEKTDIWKIPNICDHFIGNKPEAENLRFHLFKIHKQCKMEDPFQRPSARDVVTEYEKIKFQLELH